jgi:hypothetical protein
MIKYLALNFQHWTSELQEIFIMLINCMDSMTIGDTPTIRQQQTT